VQELLERHYDPAYTRAIIAHYPGLQRSQAVEVAAYTDESFARAARLLLEESLAPAA